MDLNREQELAVGEGGNVVVTACPGSGKTRVLIARVIKGVNETQSSRDRIAALTFTNRAADEIRARLDQEGVPTNQLWAGTIHSFAIEWILKPYAPYLEETRYGFTVADEYFSERLLREAKRRLGLDYFTDINTTHQRDGTIENAAPETDEALAIYKEGLREAKMIDYDEVLYFAFRLVAGNTEIAANLAAMFRLFCVDEVQDVQDLQFGILSEIYRHAASKPQMFFVGDAEQSIYESLGALTKTPEEIAEEFEIDDLKHFTLLGNYRSTQRVIDFCRQVRPDVPECESRVDDPGEHGWISFDNQTVHKDGLPDHIAELVKAALARGVPESEVCVLAPQWGHVRAIARQLVERLPGVGLDAPGLSPLYSVRDSVWYKLARLALTTPTPNRIRSRARCAADVIADLEFLLGTSVPEGISSPRRLLRTVNQLQSTETDGLPYLRNIFSMFLEGCSISLETHLGLKESYDLFFEKSESRLEELENDMPTSVDSFRKIFNHPSGVVVNTCHGVKGEEFDTVIAFGLLRGYVPHWSVIIHGSNEQASQRESKLLYVVASRAKRHLHLIAEDGRVTKSRNRYQTSTLLGRIDFAYD